MKNIRHPVLTTVFFGFVCGLSLVPVNFVLSGIPLLFDAVCLTLWLSAAGFGILLCRWSGRSVTAIFFPILILGLTAFWVPSRTSFFLLVLAIVGWIRSGICLPEPGGIKIWLESSLCLTGYGMVIIFSPTTTLTWSMAVWLLFLLQAIYLVIMEDRPAEPQQKFKQAPDPFERSSRQAVEILTRSGI
jgi:hypothetical protein